MARIITYEEQYFDQVAALLASFRVTLQALKGIQTNPDVEDAKEELSGYIKEKWPIYIALEENQVVGYILLRVDGVVWVEHIYVEERYRRQGIASLLYEKAEEYSAKLHCDTLFNWVHPNNEKIIGFLKSKGYTVLNLVELRRPYKDEKVASKIRVGDNEFDY